MRKSANGTVHSAVDAKGALAALERARRHGTDPKLAGLSSDEVIRRIKRGREEVWRNKLAARP